MENNLNIIRKSYIVFGMYRDFCQLTRVLPTRLLLLKCFTIKVATGDTGME